MSLARANRTANFRYFSYFFFVGSRVQYDIRGILFYVFDSAGNMAFVF